MDEQKLIAIDAIKKKLVGRKINYEEAYAIMDEFATAGLGDIFVAYFAASSFNNGFSTEELSFLVKAMVETGNKLDFPGVVADKHSIGGMPGTRTTPIITAIVAAAGFTIPKVSSRAITTPAGTADVMEVLCNVDFTIPQIEKIVESVGGCIVWNGKLKIAPADDVIIRVEEPLSFESFDKVIVSILAKKVAMSSNQLLLDVPVGPTMKIKYVTDAIKFKNKFVRLAKMFGMTVKVDINHQLEPLGDGVGAALEAIDVLKVLEQREDRPIKLEYKSLKLASRLLDMCYRAAGQDEDGLAMAEMLLRSHAAERKFRQIIEAQGGNPKVTVETIKLGKLKDNYLAAKSGTITAINNYHLSSLAKILGAPKDRRAGLRLLKKLGEQVRKNDILMTMYSDDKQNMSEARGTLTNLPVYTIA